ncbi:MAG: hypothetical protein ACK4UZ_01395 [Rhizobium rhizophilum]
MPSREDVLAAFDDLVERWRGLIDRYPGEWNKKSGSAVDYVGSYLIALDGRRVPIDLERFRRGDGHAGDCSTTRMQAAADLAGTFLLGQELIRKPGGVGPADLLAIRRAMTTSLTPSEAIGWRQNHTYEHHALGCWPPEKIPAIVDGICEVLNDMPTPWQPFNLYMQLGHAAPFEQENARFTVLMLALCLDRIGLWPVILTGNDVRRLDWLQGSTVQSRDQVPYMIGILQAIDQGLTLQAQRYPTHEGFPDWSSWQPSIEYDGDQLPPPIDQVGR